MESIPVTQLDPFLTSAPAMIALIIKFGIYLYARWSGAHNSRTQLYLLFLFALSIQNVAEIAHFYVLADGVLPAFEVTVYYAASIAALVLLFHLSIAVSWEARRPALARWVYGTAYAYAMAVLVLLIATDLVIAGFESIAYTVTRIPGPLYFLFELLALVLCGLVIAFFFVGAVNGKTSRARAQNALLLAAVIPIIFIVIAVVTLLHFGFKWLNASVVLPMGITFFLAVSAYAIHQHRIFEIRFFLPWSKVRRRKTRFHAAIRQLVAELADLPAPGDVVARLAQTLRCPVALLGSEQPAYSGGAERMIQVSPELLHRVDEITVGQEIVDARPDVYHAMAGYQIEAIVPFHPHNSDACGWLLLGRRFEENVYSELDFRVVEELFGRLSELFLDKFAMLRSELRSLQHGLHALTAENELLKALVGRPPNSAGNSQLQGGIVRSEDAREDEAVLAVRTSVERLPESITLLGRDRGTLQLLRREFEDVKNYVGVSSRAFQKRGQPEVLVCQVDRDSPELSSQLAAWKRRTAVYMYGRGAKEFVNQHSAALTGALVDVVDSVAAASFLSRLRALIMLRKHCFSVRNPDIPLIGSSPEFSAFIRTIQLFARFGEPVLINHHGDAEQFVEAAHYMHAWGQRPGVPLIGRAAEVANGSRYQEHDTVAILDADADVALTRDVFAQLKHANPAARVALGCRDYGNGQVSLIHDLRPEARVSSINMPTLQQRGADAGLLFHYFVLQFNIRSPMSMAYGQEDVEHVLNSDGVSTVSGLRHAVFGRFHERATRSIRDAAARPLEKGCVDLAIEQTKRSLDELVRDFEAQIIRTTLDRCGGNKAKTARVLGLRPNTLHYKLQRYGLNGADGSQKAGTAT